MKQYDCLIIGSGISGLSSALILARYGKRTAIIEQNNRIAPLLRRYKRKGVWCDPGFHYTGGLAGDGPLTTIFRYLGVDNKIETVPMNPECFDIIKLENGEVFKIPYGYKRFGEALKARFPKSAKAIDRYIGKVKAINDQTYFTNFELEFNQFPDDIHSNRTLKDFLAEVGAEHGLIRLLGNHGYVLCGAHEEEVPLYVNAYVMGSFYQHASTVARGGDALVDAFEHRLAEAGVDVFCGSAVTEIDIDQNKTIRGVKTGDGDYYQAQACISTIHPQLLTDLLPAEKMRPAFLNRLHNMENTFAPFILYYDLEEIPELIRESNYYGFFSKTGDEKNPDYLALMAVNQKTEPSGRRGLSVIKPCTHNLFNKFMGKKDTRHNQEYQDLKEKMRAEVHVSVMNYFPELQNNARIVDIASPVSLYRYTRSVEGSIYGLKQSAKYRPLFSTTSVRGLFLAGQSIQPGINGAAVSALMATSNIIDKGQLRKDLLKCR